MSSNETSALRKLADLIHRALALADAERLTEVGIHLNNARLALGRHDCGAR